MLQCSQLQLRLQLQSFSSSCSSSSSSSSSSRRNIYLELEWLYSHGLQLVALGESCPRLRRLVCNIFALDNETAISDANGKGLQALAAGCPLMEVLELDSNWALLSGAALRAIGAQMPRLRVLR